MNPTPCILLARPGNAYEVLEYNRAIGKLVIRSQYGVELAVTKERAQENGYTAIRGTKLPDPKIEGRMRFVYELPAVL